MVECKICNMTMKSNIATHLKYAHSLQLSSYYDMFFKTNDSEGLCKCCDKPTEFYKLPFGYKQYCSKECRTKGSINKFGSYNNRKLAISTKKEKFDGKLNGGAWDTRKDNIEKYCKENNCTSLKDLCRVYGQGWLTLDLPRILINKQNSAISNEHLSTIIEYSNMYHSSIIQQKITDFIKSFYNEPILQNNRQIIKPLELDIVLPNLKLAIAGDFFLTGIILFCGSLYLLACKDLLGLQSISKFIGPITPLGGLCFIIGWVILFVKVLRM